MPMRVLHVYSGNLYGGIERMLWTLARHARLRPTLEQHFALCFPGRLRDELLDAGATLHELGAVRASRPWSILAARARMGELLDRRRFDAVIAHAGWPYAIFAPVARRAGLPVVFYAHDQHTGRQWFERWAGLTTPDLILASSRFIADKVTTVFAAPEARIVPLAVAPPDSPASRSAVRASVGEGEDAVVIAIAARLEEWKGHRLLLAALSKIRHLPQWSCWLIGGAQRPREQAYLDELHAIARRDGIHARIRFLGQRSDVPALFAAADIHCQPNTGPEPFGIAFIEAMYAGLPVVTTAMGGPLEYVGPEAGILVEPGNPDALADALRRLIDEPRTRAALGAAARHAACALAHPSRILRRLDEELSALTGASVELLGVSA